MNLTATQPTAQSHLTVFPTGAARPLASSLNFLAGETRPNEIVAKVGTNGTVTIYNAAGSTHVVVDIVGWFRK
jgi:hypothetical protein